jgi:gliding motility-associated-like protein
MDIRILNRILTISFLLIGAALIAQPYASDLGAFRVDQKEGCAPLTVNITEVGFTGFCTCNYKVGPTSIGSTHTFTTPGTYVITGTAQAGASPSTDQITITVNANTQPEFEISTCNNNQVSVKVTTTQFDSYLVDFDNNNVDDATILAGGNQSTTFSYGSPGIKTISIRGKDLNALDNCTKKLQPFTAVPTLSAATINTLDVNNAASITLNYTPVAHYEYRAQVSTNSGSSFQPFQNFNSATATPQTLTLNSLAADDNYYCFRLNAYDPCTNGTVPSNIICSANFDAVAASDVNQLSWTTFGTGVLNYTVVRDLANYQTVNSLSYNDIGIDCNTEYEYSLTTNYTNGSTSRSLSKFVISFTNTIPTKIENTSAVVGEGTVELNWVPDPAFTATQYILDRSAHSGAFQFLGTSASTDYTDNTYETNSHFCYHVSYTDVCTKTSLPSDNICPIQLTGSLNNLNQVTLDWSAYEGWDLGVSRYKIEKFDADGILLSTTNSSTLTYLDMGNDPDNQIVKYRITAEPQDAALAISQSNTVTFKKQARLVFPTAFTPNKDGLNDTFTVEGQFVESMKLQIFDRWGVLLFSTEDNQAWDGMHEGRLMPESTYIWKAFITDKAGGKFAEIGSVALLRK